MSKTLKLVTAEDGSTSSTVTDRSGMEEVMDIVTMPFGVAATDDEFVQKKTAAKSALAAAGAGFLFGEGYGHKRAKQGKKAILPFMR